MSNVKQLLHSYGEDFELTRGGQNLGVSRGMMNSDEVTKRGYIGFPEEVDIQVGDWVKGKLTNNVFNIHDITVHTLRGQIFQKKCYYLTKVEFEEKEVLRQSNQSIVYNLIGANTRVNNHSTDQSINVVNTSNHDLFDEIKKILNDNVANKDELHELRLLVNDMESNQNTSAFNQSYTKFITNAANHMTILSPFIPALTQMITS